MIGLWQQTTSSEGVILFGSVHGGQFGAQVNELAPWCVASEPVTASAVECQFSVAWMTGTYDPQATAPVQLVQAWHYNFHQSLALIDWQSGLTEIWGTAADGQGYGAIAWLSGNFWGSYDQIIQ